MARINKYLEYYTDADKLIHIYLGYESITQGITYNQRLLDGGYNINDVITCSVLTSNRHIKPRYVMFNYGSNENPIKLKIIFKTLADYIEFIKLNKSNIYRYVGENANPNTINIIN